MSRRPRSLAPGPAPELIIDDDWLERDRHPRSDQGTRNGMPESGGYVWRPGDAERETEIQAKIAAIRQALSPANGRFSILP